MINNNDDKLIEGHEYDGIKELDNPLPGWWLTTFYGTIIFAFLYYIHYTFTDAPTLNDELKTAMSSIQAAKSTASSTMSEVELEKSSTPQSIQEGKAVYIAKCAACHGPNGGGLIGPNLTDSAWIHGKGTREDLYKVISTGVPDKGMPAWSEMLKAEEINSTVHFVYSIKNTNVAGGKAPQGEVVK